MNLDRRDLQDAVLFALLLAAALVGGLLCRDYPSASPIAAAALLGAVVLRRAAARWLLPIAILVVRNLFLDAYDSTAVMLSVYACFLVPVACGAWVRRSPFWIPAAAVVPSVVFFVVTNFVVWAAQPYYPQTVAGLTSCYVNAAPFFRNTLVADVAFTGVFFGVWALAGSWFFSGRVAPSEVRVEAA